MSDESTSLHNWFSDDLYIIDFQRMPRGSGLALDRLRGVLDVIWRPVGTSEKRRGEFFPYLWGFLDHLVEFLAVSKRLERGLEASWKRRERVLEASWDVYMEFFPVFKEILQSVLILNRFSFVYETRLESFFKGTWSTLKKGFACELRLSGHERKLLEHHKNHGFSMKSILRMRVECGANATDAIKQQSRKRTCIYEWLEVDFSPSWRGLGGGLEASWGILEASRESKARLECEHGTG